MLSWHNNPALKAEVVERMREHRRQDTIVHMTYQDVTRKAIGYRGCFIGCTLPNMLKKRDRDLFTWSWHVEFQEYTGIPIRLAWLLEGVFEGLPTAGKVHAKFAVQIVEAIPVGVDLESVADKFSHDRTWIFENPHEAAERFLRLFEELTPPPEPAPPLIQHIDIPEPEPILIRTVVNN